MFGASRGDGEYEYLTEGILRERLAELGHAPRFGHELTGFEQDGEGVAARLTKADGTTTTVRARYLVGADAAAASCARRWRSTSPASR